jgi:hypothetical protein
MTDSDHSIERARSNLTAKLAELRRRESHARNAIAPLRYLANPWLHLGIAAFVGYRLGRPQARSNERAALIAPTVSMPRAQTLTGTIVRAGIVALTEAIVRRVAVALVDEIPARG